jgi:hypothetical protein
MTESPGTNNKYIKRYSRGWVTEIRKGGKVYVSKFPMRLHGSDGEALAAAIEDRDRTHKSMFGFEISQEPLHAYKRRGSETRFMSLDLPPGLSVQRVRGIPTYFVVKGFCDGEQKVRFNLIELGLQKAFYKAIALLDGRKPSR